MSDTDEPNRTEPLPVSEPNRTELGTETCSIKQAAQSLGIGERAVLKRIDEGKLRAYRDGREWRLYLPLVATSEPNRTVKRTEPNEFTERTERTAAPDVESQPHPLEDVVRRQDEEIAFLRSRLEAADVEKSELRRLMMADKNELQLLRQKVSLMLAAPPVEEPPTAVEDAVQDVPEARTEQELSESGISAPMAETGVQSVSATHKRAWYQFWKR